MNKGDITYQTKRTSKHDKKQFFGKKNVTLKTNVKDSNWEDEI